MASEKKFDPSSNQSKFYDIPSEELEHPAAMSASFQSTDSDRSGQKTQHPQEDMPTSASSELIDHLKAQVALWTEACQKERAEFTNYKKRVETRRLQDRDYAVKQLVVDLLPVIDSLERSIDKCADMEDENVQHIRHGNILVLELFLRTLDKFSIKPINPLGEIFDPEQHKVIAQRKVEKTKPSTVVEVQQKGYWLHDRVIREAMVVIASDE